jgi:hypothetical protein
VRIIHERCEKVDRDNGRLLVVQAVDSGVVRRGQADEECLVATGYSD